MSPLLKIGVTRASFKHKGCNPIAKQSLIRTDKMGEIRLRISFKTRTGTLSISCLVILRFSKINEHSLDEILKRSTINVDKT